MPTYGPQTSDPKAPAWARNKSHLAGALVTFKAQLDARYPRRDHTSDGFIGDARHLAEGKRSKHNPWFETTLGHVVLAGDFDVDGIHAAWVAEQLRLVGFHGDPRLIGGGCVIYNGHITTPDFSAWVPYIGDPHTGHIHLDLALTAACESTAPWPFLLMAEPTPQPAHPGPVRPIQTAPVPAPAPAAAAGIDPDLASPEAQAEAHRTDPFRPTGHDARGRGAEYKADLGDEGPRVMDLQRHLRDRYPLYARDLAVDGVYWHKTGAVVAEYAQRLAEDMTTPAADRPGLQQADGQNVGSRIARGLARDGFV